MSIVISMSLVLFVLGVLGFLLINANRLSNHVKQNIGFSVMIKDGVKDVDIMQLQKLIDSKAYSLESVWVTKEDAAKGLQEQLGEDFIALGTDYPFPLGELQPGKIIETSNFTNELKSKLLGQNALKWLGLHQEEYAGH